MNKKLIAGLLVGLSVVFACHGGESPYRAYCERAAACTGQSWDEVDNCVDAADGLGSVANEALLSCMAAAPCEVAVNFTAAGQYCQGGAGGSGSGGSGGGSCSDQGGGCVDDLDCCGALLCDLSSGSCYDAGGSSCFDYGESCVEDLDCCGDLLCDPDSYTCY